MEASAKPFTLKVIILLVIVIVIIPLLPLFISWKWNWWEAWAYAAITILGFVLSRWMAMKRSPDILKERAGFMDQPDTKPWDKILAPLLGIGGILISVSAGLDARYNGLDTFGWWLKIISLLGIFTGFILGSYAFIQNRFFSGTVRIQTDRGQVVEKNGPYRWIRHPGYAGSLLFYIFCPFFLDSPWTFIPAIVLMIVLIIRTKLEDDTLMNELEGYREYKQKVPYRLIPGVW